eukprot:CAMPEP_0172446480 /NCGR_PEP_ID=MMETSP1065-20121228/6070_1 /TAXON_ID=265537 /ORGANISM="Amphiprora paludosa, Strain CCMP125" /LENGTH=57 /DNA_ID=CAMNT_0013197609 /DNA_START=479 /DNA_END=652 /DNA_ORIENTATION=-
MAHHDECGQEHGLNKGRNLHDDDDDMESRENDLFSTEGWISVNKRCCWMYRNVYYDG